MASLRKRGKVWYVRYRDAHGKQIETKAGPAGSAYARFATTAGSRYDPFLVGMEGLEPIERDGARIFDHVTRASM
jgi:hypothetical protein